MAIIYYMQLNPQELLSLPIANWNTAGPVMIETEGASDNSPFTTVTADLLSCIRTRKSDDCQKDYGCQQTYTVAFRRNSITAYHFVCIIYQLTNKLKDFPRMVRSIKKFAHLCQYFYFTALTVIENIYNSVNFNSIHFGPLQIRL